MTNTAATQTSPDLADWSTADLADRSTTDLADGSTADLADRSTPDLADRSTPDLSDRSTADLVRLASAQLSELVRDEMRLARAEMTNKGRHAGAGAGMLGAAGLLAAYGVGALLFFVGLLLVEVMPGWLAALIVALAVLVAAGVLALLGRSSLKRAVPPVPAETAASLRADLAEVTDAASRRGQR